MTPKVCWLLVAVGYLVTLIITVIVGTFVVLVLAGPHGGMLPDYLQPVVLISAWIAVIVVPIWAAYRIHRELFKATVYPR
ncbi:MAG: hypothetical protein ACE5K1_00205 [Acidiferrobacterales bacterium]